MRESDSGVQTPRKILLATDLDSRSDRALDRALQLAVQWQAVLHVVHAIRPDHADAWWPAAGYAESVEKADAELVERQIRCDLRASPDDLVVHVAAGEPAAVIEQTATREGCDLIITGSRGAAHVGPINTTTAQLLRRAPQSLLVVKARPHGAYRKVLVGTDFTRESRLGLEAAATWFGGADLALMHALDIPYQSLLMADGREHGLARMEREAMASLLAEADISPALREQIHTHVEFGHPELMLRNHGLANDVDLVVIGALSRGLAFHMLVGGNAGRIMHSAAGDVLMVRAARAR